MNTHTFSQKQIFNLFRLGKKFINFKEADLFRGWADDEGTELIQNVAMPIMDLSLKTPAKLKLVEEALEVTRTKENLDPFIKKLEGYKDQLTNDAWATLIATLRNEKMKNKSISGVTWSDMIKKSIIHGDILNRESIKVKAAHALFQEELTKHFQDMFTAFYLPLSKDDLHELRRNLFNDELSKLSLSQAMENFLVRLTNMGEKKSVSIIHDFIHLATKAIGEESGSNKPGMATMLAVSLQSALELTDAFLPPKDYTDLGTAMKIEKSFMAVVALACLEKSEDNLAQPLFAKSFREQESVYNTKKVDPTYLDKKAQQYTEILWAPQTTAYVDLTFKPNTQEPSASSSQSDKKQKGKQKRIERPHSMPIHATTMASCSDPTISKLGFAREDTPLFLQNYNNNTKINEPNGNKVKNEKDKKKNIFKNIFKKGR